MSKSFSKNSSQGYENVFRLGIAIEVRDGVLRKLDAPDLAKGDCSKSTTNPDSGSEWDSPVMVRRELGLLH